MSRKKYSFLTGDWRLNEALNELDNRIADLEDSWDAFVECEVVDEIRQRVKRIEDFLRVKYQNEWDSFEKVISHV